MSVFADDDIDFAQYMTETDASVAVRRPEDYRLDTKRRLRERAKAKLVHLPWQVVKNVFDFRPGEITVYAGQNGHGKSKAVMQIVLSLLGQNQKVCFANFEAKPVTTIMNMTRMFAGTNPFNPEYQSDDAMDAFDALIDEFIDWANPSLSLYDQYGDVSQGRILAVCRYAAKERGVHHIVIDNLAKCIDGEDDYNGQKLFVSQLCRLAMDYGVHIHLVHHLKKPPKEADKPDKSDVKGSGSIVDQIDNLFLIWRNKPKEESAKEGKKDRAHEPDQIIYCRKQRNAFSSENSEPTILLWLHKDSGQFLERDGAPVMFFPNWPHVSSF